MSKTPSIYVHRNLHIDTIVETKVNNYIDSPDKEGKVASQIVIDNDQQANEKDIPVAVFLYAIFLENILNYKGDCDGKE